MNRRIVLRVAVLALLVGSLAACGSDKAATPAADSTPSLYDTTPAGATTPADTTPAASGGAEVSIKDFTFTVPASVKAGEAISIVNNDGFGHTFSESGGAFSVSVSGGATESLVIEAAGTYSVVCQIHPQMQVSLTVE